MTELLFGLTVIFIGYVIYEVFKTVSAGGTEIQPAQTVASPSASISPPPATPSSAQEGEATENKPLMLRNPKDGEISPAPRNYRFAKKWIKEALVAEGLLDKVYKNSELTVAVTEKVKAALETFKTLEKYHA